MEKHKTISKLRCHFGSLGCNGFSIYPLVLVIAFALVLAVGLGLGLRLVQALAHVHATSQVLMGREQWGATCLSFGDFGGFMAVVCGQWLV